MAEQNIKKLSSLLYKELVATSSLCAISLTRFHCAGERKLIFFAANSILLRVDIDRAGLTCRCVPLVALIKKRPTGDACNRYENISGQKRWETGGTVADLPVLCEAVMPHGNCTQDGDNLLLTNHDTLWRDVTKGTASSNLPRQTVHRIHSKTLIQWNTRYRSPEASTLHRYKVYMKFTISEESDIPRSSNFTLSGRTHVMRNIRPQW
jgi:hypothetical protein